MDCFRCGQDDHLSYDCPTPTRPHSAPPGPWPTAGPDQGRPFPPPFSTLYQRPADEIADPEPWATQIRQAMGWASGSDEKDARARLIAAGQVADSRRERLWQLPR